MASHSSLITPNSSKSYHFSKILKFLNLALVSLSIIWNSLALSSVLWHWFLQLLLILTLLTYFGINLRIFDPVNITCDENSLQRAPAFDWWEECVVSDFNAIGCICKWKSTLHQLLVIILLRRIYVVQKGERGVEIWRFLWWDIERQLLARFC